MQVILLEDVSNLGNTGDQVDVKPGYARNYLLPRGLAVEANTRNARTLKHRHQMVAARVEQKRQAAMDLAAKVAAAEVTITMLAGEEDRLFGSVTKRDIEQALAEEGLVVDRKKIVLDDPIKTLGVHTVQVKVHTDVATDLKVWVVKRED